MLLEDNIKYQHRRKVLVAALRDRGIRDERVLEAIEKVPRHFFFNSDFIEYAYEDSAFPIGEGQTISQPYTVAYQTELLNVQKNDKVLEIGTGSGYQSCILLVLGAKVFTVEYNKVLYERTKGLLARIGYHPRTFLGDGTKGLASFQPYDKILVTAGAPIIPSSLICQLKEKGTLVIPLGDQEGQVMTRITKIDAHRLKKETFSRFKFVPLLGEEGYSL